MNGRPVEVDWDDRGSTDAEFVHLSTPEASGRFPFYAHPECVQHLPSDVTGAPRLPRIGAPGPVQGLHVTRVEERAPYVATAWGDAPRSWPSDRLMVGGGVSYDRELAERKATLEVIERFATLMPVRAPLRWGTAAQMSRPLSAEPGEHIPSWWVVGSHLTDGADCSISHASVQIVPRAIERPVNEATSTGCAVHLTKGDAIMAGWAECLERRGFAEILAGAPRTALDLGKAGEVPRALRDVAGRLGWRTHAVGREFPAGFTTVVVAHTLRASRDSRVVIGSAGSRDCGSALESAALEAHGMLAQAIDEEAATDPDLEGQPAVAALSRLARGAGAKRPVGAEPEAMVVDRGNQLTRQLGVHATQVLLSDAGETHR